MHGTCNNRDFLLARRATYVSMVVTGTAGFIHLQRYWSSKGLFSAGIVRGSLLLLTLAVVHVAGFHLYRNQWVNPDGSRKSAAPRLDLFPEYRKALIANAILQGIMLLITSLILDGGHLCCLTLCAICGYWAGAALIVGRRPQYPCRSDIPFLRFGFVGLFPVVVYLVPIVSWVQWGRM